MPTTTPFQNLITFSRGSNATVTGPNGLIQWAPHNLLTFSEQFDNAAWNKVAATILANTVVSPDGTTDAETLREDTTNAGHSVDGTSVTFTSGVTYTASVFGKMGAGTRGLCLRFSSSAFPGSGRTAFFSLSTGTVVSNEAGTTATIELIGNGWYRCTLTATANQTATISGMFIILTDATNNRIYTGDGTSSVHIWGAQLELGSTATTYNPTTVKNLLGFSEDFNDGGWVKTRCSIVAGAQANPVNGLFNAQKLMEDTTASATHLVARVLAATSTTTPYTLSVYAKAAGRTTLWLVHANFTSISFNLSAGTCDAGGVIASAGNGWYRCSVTATAPDLVSRAYSFQLGAPGTSYTGDGSSGVYIYGAQLSDSASLDPYVPTPGAAPSSTAYYGPRFDYDPVTRQPKGILIEEARTNLLTYSEQFDNASWNKAGTTTVIADTNVSPDGTTTTDTINFPAGSDWIWKSFSGAASTAYVFSIWLSGSGTTDIGIYDSVTGGNNRTAVTLTATPTRYTYTATTAAASADFRVYIGRAFGASNATAVRVWGAQLEAGAFATSYIPTIASTVTRSADVATITGSLFSQWYRQDQGAFVVKADSAVGTSLLLYSPASVTDGTGNNLIRGYIYNGSRGFSVSAAGVSQADMAAAGYLPGVVGNWGFGYQSNDFALSVNGSSPATDTSGTVPTVDRLSVGGINSGNQLNGHIRSISFIPFRSADFQLQNVTRQPPWNVLAANGTLYNIGGYSARTADGTAYAVPQTVLSSTGISYNVI